MGVARSLELGLQELMEESNLIVEVRFKERFKEEIGIADKNVKNTGRPLPSFIKKGCVFVVNKILKNNTELKGLPESISVPDENWRRLFSEHKEKHLKTPDRAYTIKEYHTDVTSLEKASIIFLSYFQGMFELTAQGAFESAEASEKIEMLLVSTKRHKK
jgi:hypothetical protein